jgi:hypothetical protein
MLKLDFQIRDVEILKELLKSLNIGDIPCLIDGKMIPLKKKLIIKLLGESFAFTINNTPFYYGHCQRHGYFISYLQGYKRYLRCPECEL